MLVILALSLVLQSGPVTGRASVIDGDTLEIRGRRVRLWGVDAPEARQPCMRDGRPWRCGTEAANRLDAIIAGRPVTCEPRGRPDRYGRMIATCAVTADCATPAVCPAGGRDLGTRMVAEGLALDDARYSRGHHAASQADARRDGLGLWAGTFEMPWDWRRK